MPIERHQIESYRYTARKATEADIPALKEITGHDESRRLTPGGRSYHPENCMMVVEADGKIIGSVFVLFVRPSRWPDADDTSQLPQLISLVVEVSPFLENSARFRSPLWLISTSARCR